MQRWHRQQCSLILTCCVEARRQNKARLGAVFCSECCYDLRRTAVFSRPGMLALDESRVCTQALRTHPSHPLMPRLGPAGAESLACRKLVRQTPANPTQSRRSSPVNSSAVCIVRVRPKARLLWQLGWTNPYQLRFGRWSWRGTGRSRPTTMSSKRGRLHHQNRRRPANGVLLPTTSGTLLAPGGQHRGVALAPAFAGSLPNSLASFCCGRVIRGSETSRASLSRVWSLCRRNGHLLNIFGRRVLQWRVLPRVMPYAVFKVQRGLRWSKLYSYRSACPQIQRPQPEGCLPGMGPSMRELRGDTAPCLWQVGAAGGHHLWHADCAQKFAPRTGGLQTVCKSMILTVALLFAFSSASTLFFLLVCLSYNACFCSCNL